MEPTISLPSPQPPQPLFRTPGGLLNDKENMPKSGANRKRSHSAPNSHTFLKTLPTPPLHHNANESYVANVVDDHCLRCVLLWAGDKFLKKISEKREQTSVAAMRLVTRRTSDYWARNLKETTLLAEANIYSCDPLTLDHRLIRGTEIKVWLFEWWRSHIKGIRTVDVVMSSWQ
uniref:DUF1767 domain-containing protein n=1 Tax=Heterorhabditis bacteriophora TaxID=37862 RepID=A0A1I7XC40_HETBA